VRNCTIIGLCISQDHQEKIQEVSKGNVARQSILTFLRWDPQIVESRIIKAPLNSPKTEPTHPAKLQQTQTQKIYNQLIPNAFLFAFVSLLPFSMIDIRVIIAKTSNSSPSPTIPSFFKNRNMPTTLFGLLAFELGPNPAYTARTSPVLVRTNFSPPLSRVLSRVRMNGPEECLHSNFSRVDRQSRVW
jgi:hypothetical protein